MEPGLNVIAIHATARGNAPSVRPTVSAAGRILPVAWLLRTDTPPEGWPTAIHAEGWETVSPEELRWPAGARAVYLSCALYVSDPGPALFPKMETCYFPRGSSQLMRFYVRAPLEVPADGYRMVVEAPAALQRSAVEPISGAAPVANAGGSFDLPKPGPPSAHYEVPPADGAVDPLGQCAQRQYRLSDRAEHRRHLTGAPHRRSSPLRGDERASAHH